jgi:uncharacterized protein (TIGR03000 family)
MARMLRRTFPGIALAGSALTALVLTAAPSSARGPGPDAWPYPPSYYGYDLDDLHPGYYGGGRYKEYYGYGRGYGLANYPQPYTGPLWWPNPGAFPRHPPAVYPAPLASESLSFPIPQADPSAHLVVEVPDDAEVWLEGSKTQQTGTTRRYVSPPLVRGKDYTYELRVRWTADGHPVERSKTVVVHAGEQVRITFPPEPDREVLPTPRREPADPER